jgi:hypothetical protein
MDVEWPRDDRADDTSENLGLAAAPDQTTQSGLVERLAAYITTLVRLSAEDSLILRRRIAVAIGDPRNLEIVKAEYARTPEAAKRVCLFAPFWRRSPQTWNPKGGTALLDHLFVHYPVPRFLYPEWSRDLYPGWGAYYADDEREVERETPGFKWLCWFILLGQGGSLRRAAEWFEWRIPARFQPGLYEAPCGASPVEACVFAEVRRLGGSEIDGARILRNPAFVVDPTEFSAVESYKTFWQDTVRWLIAHRDAVTDEQSHQILSWAMHQYTETERRAAQPFTWKGRRVRTVLERSLEYHDRLAHRYDYQLARDCGPYVWRPHGWDWILEEGQQDRWTFRELTSGEELLREGQTMNHCVAGYAPRCVSGYSAIVSLSHNDTPRVTLEVNPRTRQIVQARGNFNRPANQPEQRVIDRWMKTVLQPDASERAG